MSDVSSVTVAGPCKAASADDGGAGVSYIAAEDVGTCRVTVSFLGGAPAFVRDVPITASGGSCCPFPASGQGDVTVPEVGAAGATAHDSQ